MKPLIMTFFMFFFTVSMGFADATVEILTSEYQPYSGITGPALGCELLNAAFARKGVQVKWKILPQDRQKGMVAAGISIAFAQSIRVVSQAEKTDFIFNDAPYLYLNVVAFYPKTKYPQGLGLKGPDDLKHKTVGVVRGTGSISILQKAGANLDVANDKDLLMKKLIHGRYDIAVVADLTGLYALKTLNKVNQYGYAPLYSSPLDLIFSKKNPESADMRTKFISGLKQIKADGTYMAILRKYYPNGQINKETLPEDMR